jgi:aminomethyltransferase
MFAAIFLYYIWLNEITQTMKTTAFNARHHQLGARMVEFAGYEMPIEYTGINTEHLAVRHAAGLFDVSHMGEIWVRGSHAMDLLNHVLSNDPSVLMPGKAQYTCFPNGKGGIVDDLIVHMFDAETYLLVVNAANIEKDWNWIVSNNKVGAELENASPRFSQLAVQGPAAQRILQSITRIDLAKVPYFNFTVGEVAGIENVIIAATGYTGSGGYELYTDNPNPVVLWDRLYEAGLPLGLVPVGLAARDTLRLEMGYCLYGNDIDDTTSPIEAGLGWITKPGTDRPLIDGEFLRQQRTTGVNRKLVGIELIDRGIPRQHYPLYDVEGTVIGEVTSGTMSPSLKTGIGMGYVKTAFAGTGMEMLVGVRDKKLKAKVVRLPFYTA